jgi:quercetin dioxygenase-like cupin family protein
MRTFELLTNVEFNERNAHAESLHSNEEGRALRFAFLPEQRIEEHDAPHSPAHLVILQERGMFAGGDGVERECSQGMMVAFDAAEPHTVRALDEKLVYIAIYSENPATHAYESEHRKMLESQPQQHEHSEEKVSK